MHVTDSRLCMLSSLFLLPRTRIWGVSYYHAKDDGQSLRHCCHHHLSAAVLSSILHIFWHVRQKDQICLCCTDGYFPGLITSNYPRFKAFHNPIPQKFSVSPLTTFLPSPNPLSPIQKSWCWEGFPRRSGCTPALCSSLFLSLHSAQNNALWLVCSDPFNCLLTWFPASTFVPYSIFSQDSRQRISLKYQWKQISLLGKPCSDSLAFSK